MYLGNYFSCITHPASYNGQPHTQGGEWLFSLPRLLISHPRTVNVNRELETPDHTKVAVQTSIDLTPFWPPCTPSKLASHASRNASTTARSLSSQVLNFSSTSFSKEEERQAETSHRPSNNPSPHCTRGFSLSSCHPASRASSDNRLGLSTVRTFEVLLGLRHSSAACVSTAST